MFTEDAASIAADAIRAVTAKVQTELERGRRSARIDAHDLVDLLLAIADEIEARVETATKGGA